MDLSPEGERGLSAQFMAARSRPSRSRLAASKDPEGPYPGQASLRSDPERRIVSLEDEGIFKPRAEALRRSD